MKLKVCTKYGFRLRIHYVILNIDFAQPLIAKLQGIVAQHYCDSCGIIERASGLNGRMSLWILVVEYSLEDPSGKYSFIPQWPGAR